MPQQKTKKPPREGFRRRINPWYSGMSRRQIALETAKTVGQWALFTVGAYVYWAVLLLLLSMILLSVWQVSFVRILIYSGILCAVSALVYAGMLVHRKYYY